jgi:transcriptional regulator with XRE-family HTH domain
MLRELLIRARKEAGLSVTELARQIAERTGRGVEAMRTTIHRYEAEDGPEPRPSTVKDVLDALELDLRLVPRKEKKLGRRA